MFLSQTKAREDDELVKKQGKSEFNGQKSLGAHAQFGKQAAADFACYDTGPGKENY